MYILFKKCFNLCSSLTQVHTCLFRVRAKYLRKILTVGSLLQSGPQLSSFPLLLHCVWNSNYLIPWQYSGWCSSNIYCNVCLEQNIQILLWNGGLLRVKCTRWVSQVDFQPPVVWKLLTSSNWAFTETRALEKLELQVLKHIHVSIYIYLFQVPVGKIDNFTGAFSSLGNSGWLADVMFYIYWLWAPVRGTSYKKFAATLGPSRKLSLLHFLILLSLIYSSSSP